MSQQYKLSWPHHIAMSLDDFLLTSSNAQAVRWLFETPPTAWPSHMLILHGPAGCGKSHLLQSWCQHVGAMAVCPESSVLESLARGEAAAPAFAFDDADKIAAFPAQQEWLVHFYNATKALHVPVVLAAQKPVAVWGLMLKDIETRLKSCQSVAIEEPDDDLIHGLFLKLFADRQLRVENDVVEYLVKRATRTGTAVQKLVQLLDEEALRAGKKITIPFAQKFLTGGL
ncbi:MAG: hypothetical protein FWF24_00245 [Alphaproteobacteria bacterium]|nr:hypothetical protein [Alphaproteobacteria bacterium]